MHEESHALHEVKCPSRANSAQIRQSRPDYGRGSSYFEANSEKIVPSALGMGHLMHEGAHDRREVER